MIRASAAKDAQNAFMAITPGGFSSFQTRLASGASTNQSTFSGPTAPYWVKLVRSGDTFTGYRSSNGSSWTSQGSATIPMGSSVCIGLAVTSHDDTQLCTCTFDNVQVISAGNDYLAVNPGVAGTVNVLTNDIVPSGTLSVTSFTQGSKGTVVNNGNGSLGYTSNGGAVGMDVFSYTASNGAGITITGKVFVVINGLQAWYPFEEGAGTTTADLISNHDGTLLGGTWSTGVQGTDGLTLNGTSDNVAIPALNLKTNTLTVTGWVKRNGSQTANSGIFFTRAGSNVVGLQFGSTNELRYNWNDSSSTVSWNSGLVPPDGQWTFVALVVTPTNAKIYMRPLGGSMTTATNTISNATVSFDGLTFIGRDPYDNSRYLKGSMDEVRIYNTALTSTQITALASPSAAVASSATGPGTATGSISSLSVLGSSTAGAESTLTYTWSVEALPVGAPMPTFSVNGTNAAKNATVTFSVGGNYTFLVTITDAAGSSVVSEVRVSVVATLANIALSPSSANLSSGGSVQLTPTGTDQFGASIALPSLTWTVSGVGTVSSSGLYTAGGSGGSATVTASTGAVSASSTITVASPANGTWTNLGGAHGPSVGTGWEVVLRMTWARLRTSAP